MPARWIKVKAVRLKTKRGQPWVCRWSKGPKLRQQVIPARFRKPVRLRETYRAALENRLNGLAAAEPAAEPVTLQAAIAEFLANCKAKNLRPRSIETYAHVLRRFERTLKQRLLRDIGRRDVTAYLAGRRVRAVTRLRDWTHLHVFFSWAVEDNYIQENPAVRKHRPRAKPPIPFAFTAEEAGRIIEVARGCRPWVSAACRLALIGGLRAGELAAVAAEHVDWRRGVLRVPAQKSAHERRVGLDAETLGLLHDLRYRGDRILWGGPESPFVTEFAFRRHLGAEVRAICREAGVPEPVKPLHDLRRTCATLMADAGVPAFALGQVMGHQSVATTATYYLAPNARRAAKQGLRGVLNSVPGLVRHENPGDLGSDEMGDLLGDPDPESE